MVTMTNRDVWDCYEALMALAKHRLPLATSYEVARAIKVLRPEFDLLAEMRNQLIDRHAVVGKDGKKVQHRPGSYEIGDPDALAAEWKEITEKSGNLDLRTLSLPPTLEVEPSILWPLVMVGLLEEPAGSENGAKANRATRRRKARKKP